MERTKISIIVPCYNVERYLDRCVNSILHQTLKDIEIILVDDGSPDKVPIMCDEYAKIDNRIKIVHKQNEGLGEARNTGLNVASGKYVAFIDSDDYISPIMMETLYNNTDNEKADAVYCGYKIVDEDGNERTSILEVKNRTVFEGKEQCRKICLEMLAKPGRKDGCSYNMSVWHSIYNLDYLKTNNIRFVSERKILSEDIVFDVEFFSKANKVVFLNEAFYYYCFNGSSLSRKFDLFRHEKNIIHYKELETRLIRYDYPILYKKHLKKYFLRITRSYIFGLLNSANDVSVKEQYLRNVLEDQIWNGFHFRELLCSLSFVPFFSLLSIKLKSTRFIKCLNWVVTSKRKILS